MQGDCFVPRNDGFDTLSLAKSAEQLKTQNWKLKTEYMFQTAYRPLVALSKAMPSYTGGICKLWHVPIQDILEFPVINPQTQMLVGSPILKANKTWYGPVNIPDNKRGWKETQDRNKPGIWFKQQVTGFVPGNSHEVHINIQNLMHHQHVVVGKLRQSGMYIVLGNDICGLLLDHETGSGDGANETPGTKISFQGESICKALLMPTFEIDPDNGRHFITEDDIDFVMEDGTTLMKTE